ATARATPTNSATATTPATTKPPVHTAKRPSQVSSACAGEAPAAPRSEDELFRCDAGSVIKVPWRVSMIIETAPSQNRRSPGKNRRHGLVQYRTPVIRGLRVVSTVA
ncbi:MAG: hypothetical protein ACK559_19260, partial [bacterium]